MHKKTEKSKSRFFIYKKLKKQFYLFTCILNGYFFNESQKNFGEIAILKIWELISVGGAKTHFGKIALK